MSPPFFPGLLLLLLLLLATAAASAATGSNKAEEVDDLQYLIDNSDDIPANDLDGWSEGGDDDDDDDLFQDQDHDLPGHQPQIDETHVVVLTAANFSSFLAATRHVMVEFYAPWCGHCQELAPEYAAAAAHLAAHPHQPDLALAKVDATEETDLAQKYDVQGFPTILFFIDGVPKDYNGARTKDAIVDWISKKLGPAVQNVTTVDDAERILTGDDKAVLAFLHTLSGPHSDELAAASRLEDSIDFYQTTVPDVAKLFHIDAAAKRPSIVLLKKEEEKLTFYDGEFKASAIADFVSANKLPLVTTLTQETSPSIFGNPIKKQILLFAVASESSKFLPIFKEAAKPFKGKLLFVFVERDNEEVGEPVANYFGITGQETTVLAYTGNEDARKFFLDAEVSLEAIKVATMVAEIQTGCLVRRRGQCDDLDVNGVALTPFPPKARLRSPVADERRRSVRRVSSRPAPPPAVRESSEGPASVPWWTPLFSTKGRESREGAIVATDQPPFSCVLIRRRSIRRRSIRRREGEGGGVRGVGKVAREEAEFVSF